MPKVTYACVLGSAVLEHMLVNSKPRYSISDTYDQLGTADSSSKALICFPHRILF